MISTLAAQFDALMNALQQVRSAILSKQPAHTLPLTATEKTLGLQSLQVLADLITDVWYRDGQDGRETRSRHGLLTADDELLQLIRNANEQKDLFRAEVQKVQAELDKAGLDEALGSLGARHARTSASKIRWSAMVTTSPSDRSCAASRRAVRV